MAIADPTRKLGASFPDLEAHELGALDLMARPTLSIPIPTRANNGILVGGAGILAGLTVRESQLAGAAITPLTATSSGGAQANNVTLAAGGAGVTTYVTGFEITGAGATAASVIQVTMVGVVGGTKVYFISIPAGIAIGITPLIVSFTTPGLPASAANLGLSLNVPSFGAGNTSAAVTLNGYQVALGLGTTQVPSGIQVSADLLDGLDLNGEELLPIMLPAFGVFSMMPGPHGPVFTRGIFLQMNTGFLRGAVYVKI